MDMWRSNDRQSTKESIAIPLNNKNAKPAGLRNEQSLITITYYATGGRHSVTVIDKQYFYVAPIFFIFTVILKFCNRCFILIYLLYFRMARSSKYRSQ